MNGDRPQLRRGRIVYAWVRDRRCFKKKRPALILTATDKIKDEEQMTVMAITTTIPQPTPADHIPLPWHRDGHPETRLNARCAVVIGWYDRVDPDKVLGFGGDVPAKLVMEILKRVDLSG